uniref:Alpha tubulin N acetyltransferase n=1 Tax=Echinococcus granulosus TaxID=6210 RepID=A0A068WP69_ECHGR|nr:alpha tubulin N acetyltransferase [Echinococcus granulosus]
MESFKMVARVFPNRISKFTCDHEYISSGLVIDRLGRESAEAQSLPSIVTSLHKLRYTNHRCYVLTCTDKGDQRSVKVEPVCVLDFYVSADFQRRGYGKELFEGMLQEEGLVATDLPIDSPSPKMLSFMKKHYNQDHPLRQSNNFVVFPEFFHHVDAFLVPRYRRSRSPLHSAFPIPTRCSSVSTLPAPVVEAKRPPSSPSSRIVQRCSSLSLRATPDLEARPEPTPKGDVKSSPSVPKALEKSAVQAHIPQLRSRGESGFLRQGPALRYSKRLVATTPSMLFRGHADFSSTDINTLWRLNERQARYNYQRAAWANNRHTRLW